MRIQTKRTNYFKLLRGVNENLITMANDNLLVYTEDHKLNTGE